MVCRKPRIPYKEAGSTERMNSLTREEEKALRHIVGNGDDRQLSAKKWYPVKISLFRAGLLRRRIGDWAWVPTDAARKACGASGADPKMPNNR